MDYLNDLHEMCDILSRELGEATEKIKHGGGKLSGSDLDYVDKLTHALKSIKTTIAMIEAEDNGSYASRPYYGTYSHPYNSYAGRRNARRDSMGRYSSRGYSRDTEMVAELRELMEGAPDESVKHDFQRLITKIEQMA